MSTIVPKKCLEVLGPRKGTTRNCPSPIPHFSRVLPKSVVIFSYPILPATSSKPNRPIVEFTKNLLNE